MSKEFNATVTRTALAVWAKKDPIEELKAIGFKEATEMEFKVDDICLIIYPEESEIAFGLVSNVGDDHVTFTFYEQIGSGERAMHVQIPREMFLALKVESAES